ncbi:STR3N protein, partial [Polypterus senegalus]
MEEKDLGGSWVTWEMAAAADDDDGGTFFWRADDGAHRQPPRDMENALSRSLDSRGSLPTSGSVSPAQLAARLDSYETGGRRSISDVRRTFCLFVTFDLLFITLLWIIELNVNGGIQERLKEEILHYDYHSSFFDIFVIAVFRFAVLILAYAVCQLRHWWAVAVTTAVTSAFLIVKVILSKLLSQGAFGYLLPIISFILAWIETWFLDFKVLPQETENENSKEGLGGLLFCFVCLLACFLVDSSLSLCYPQCHRPTQFIFLSAVNIKWKCQMNEPGMGWALWGHTRTEM